MRLIKFCPSAKIVHVDIDPSSISKTVDVDIPIVGPMDCVLDEMLDIIAEMKADKKTASLPDESALESWWNQIDEWRKRHAGRYDQK